MNGDDALSILSLSEVEIAYPGTSLLSVLGLGKRAAAVRGVSFDLRRGETLALVGESGSGKSTIARAICGLITPRGGTITYEGTNIDVPIGRRSRALKRDLQIVFQNPDASLNPRHSVGFILGQAVRAFHGLDPAAVRKMVETLLSDVKLSANYASRYPRQLSGGERQRVAIARALAARPKVLVCDEILSALDVSVQAEIIELLRSLQKQQNISVLFISHDLAVVKWLADRVAVLRHGELCEIGNTEELFSPPFHIYTKELLNAVPEIGKRIT